MTDLELTTPFEVLMVPVVDVAEFEVIVQPVQLVGKTTLLDAHKLLDEALLVATKLVALELAVEVPINVPKFALYVVVVLKVNALVRSSHVWANLPALVAMMHFQVLLVHKVPGVVVAYLFSIT